MADKESLEAFRLALALVKAKGNASEDRDGVKMIVYQAEQISITFIPAKEERPNGLDVRHHGDHSTKVLDVIWTNGNMPLILAYHGGTWEKLLR